MEKLLCHEMGVGSVLAHSRIQSAAWSCCCGRLQIWKSEQNILMAKRIVEYQASKDAEGDRYAPGEF